MGSGCTGNSTSGKCFQELSSNCVKWQGGAIPALNICNGDTITEVELAIIDRLNEALEGSGIDLSSLDTTCDFIADQIAGQDKTLLLILQTLVNSNCTLKSLITDLTTQVNTPVTYDKACLPSETGSTTAAVLQAAVYEVCDLWDAIDEINNNSTSNVNIGNYIGSNIVSPGNYGVKKTGTGASTVVTVFGFPPPFTPLWSYAPLTNFDSSGKGNTGTAFEGWYICNGLNGTIDMRGWTAAGATNLPGINGPALYTQVDPDVNSDLAYSSNVLDRKGEVKHQLTIPELAAHDHAADDSGHTHTALSGQTVSVTAGDTGSSINPINGTTGTGYANVTIGTTGENKKHENRQPTVYGYWIVRLS